MNSVPIAISKPTTYPRLIEALLLLIMAGLFSGCEQQPPSERTEVALPTYQMGDADNGKVLYDELCENCHKLEIGRNKKAPHLLNIYGATAGELSDYKYSEVMLNSGWTWDADTLDKYIADAQTAMPQTRMFSDPINNKEERADIIAYLSTLRVTPQPALDK